ncbi:geranylgeranyl pyrophosphate synthase [Elsinoe australis]|uniref:Geranylgeranyl pyrophosphate synthase n=1 Tax=Elsinoe australis TaxID=40998 RepID=A0A4V6DSV2_9PEZI|nr:geranylgeranyl pyrophosphate synthase [Elsinoe australis]
MTSDTMPGTIPPRTSSHNAVNGANLANSTQRMSRPLMTEEEWISQKKSRRASNTVGSPLSPTDTAQANEILQQPAHWSREKEKILLGPYDYMLGHPGKDIRSQLINSFNVWLKVPEHSLAIITRVVGMLHTSSLLVDDVEDNSLLRRGVPVAHSIFGTAQTINSANYVYFVALQELLKLNNPELIRIYTEELLNLHRGQGMDLFWRDTLTCPSEDDYLEMVGNKTGGLFRLAVKLMQAESQSKIDCVPLVNSIGLIFQILDDYKNLSDDTYTANKGLCEDLTEGKFSFPVIHSIRTEPENLVLINILKQKTRDDEVKRYAMAYMEKTGSFSYTRKILRGLTKRALALLDEMEEGRDKAEGIRGLLEKMRVEEPVNGHSKNGS